MKFLYRRRSWIQRAWTTGICELTAPALGFFCWFFYFFLIESSWQLYGGRIVLLLKNFVWFNCAQGRGFPWRSICHGTRKRNPARNDPQHTEQPGHEAHQWRWDTALPSPADCPKGRTARGAAPVLTAPCWSWQRIPKGLPSLCGPLLLFVNGL